MGLTIGVDIGGTKVAAGVVAPTGEVLEQVRVHTPALDTKLVLGSIVEVVRKLSASHDVEAVGIGAAGWIDATGSTVLFSPNLSWRDEPLRDAVAAAVNLPVTLDNDGNAAAWAEFVFGAGRAFEDSMAMFTIGTGIGSGVVLRGQLLRGSHGMGGEPGHMRVVPGGLLCACGRRGCLEQYASGSALVRYARQAASARPETARALLELAGGSVDAISGPLVTRAAQAGDAASTAAFEQVGAALGGALSDIVHVYDPEVIVLGGGVAEAGALILDPTLRAYHETLSHRGTLPVASLILAELGNTAGLIGAADLARRR